MFRRAPQPIQPAAPDARSPGSPAWRVTTRSNIFPRYPGEVFGIRQVDNWRLAGARRHGLQCRRSRRTRASSFAEHRFAAVLDCAGNCASNRAGSIPRWPGESTCWALKIYLEQVIEHRARLVHLSIDLVFSGLEWRARRRGRHRSGHGLWPHDGRRRTADRRRGPRRLHAADLATDGRQLQWPRRSNRLDPISLQESKPATLYFDEIRTPTYTDCLSPLCEAVLASDLAGLYHAGGPQRLSLYEIAQVVNRVGGYDPRLLHGCPPPPAGPFRRELAT